MAVLDASVILEILLRRPAGLSVMERVDADERHAPHLVDIEVMHALRRLVHLRALSSADAELGIDTLPKLRIQRHSHQLLLPRIWQLRTSMTAYDAAYVSLAESLSTPLLTCDGKLSRSHGHHAEIILLQ